MRFSLRILICSLLSALAAGLFGADAPPAPTAALGKEDRKTLYHLAEGSELFPADWLAALDGVKTGKPFLEDLGRFGLIADPDGPVIASSRGKFPLPVGVTLAPSPAGGRMVGVNCAACHVARMTLGEATVDIDGAPNLLDIEGFYQEAFDSLAAALRSRKALVAFLGRLEKSEDPLRGLAGALRQALEDPDPKSPLLDHLVDHLRELVGQGKTRPGKSNPDDFFRLLTIPKPDRADLDKKVKALFAAQSSLLEKRGAAVSRIGEALASKLDKGASSAESKLSKALADLGPAGLGQLEARVIFLRRLKAQHSPDSPQYPPGPGRVDAFVTARNLLFPAKDAIPATSPVRFPSIWNLASRKWLHWDANTNSVLERNIGQALGLGALATEDGHSTVLPRNLHALETVVRKLKAPAWPKAFGPIDAAKAKKGRDLYVKYCVGCHREHKGEDEAFAGFGVYTLATVGTDPERATNFARTLGDGTTPFVDALAKKLRAIKKQAYADNAITPAEQKTFDLPDGDIRWVATKGYVARSLEGAWATAPFLHNGSVPTLDDLLKPEADRPLVFPVGHREYDPAGLGYVAAFAAVPKGQRTAMRIYDTRQKGNSNAGHSGKAFGTELCDDDRKALLEYLKGHKD